MSHHIKPESVSAYLSGICNTLEPHFPAVRSARQDPLVTKTLAGMRKLHGSQAPDRKRPLLQDDLHSLLAKYGSGGHDDQLFLAILFTGFHALMRLGELVQSNSKAKRSFRKLTKCHTLRMADDSYSFHLPFHKGDRFFEGNTIMIAATPDSELCPLKHMRKYVSSRDELFPLIPELWLTKAGNRPTYSWFIKRLRAVLDDDVAGHSLRSGGATALALAGVPDDVIRAMGRWASETFRIYIRKHPVLLQALIHGRSMFVRDE